MLNIAHKDTALSHLGRDKTRPPHQLCVSVSQGAGYPVELFFYGTLAATDRLARLFDIEANKATELRPAICLDGHIQIWANKYRALVVCLGGKVQGHVFRVKSAEEEALRAYEGGSYEAPNARVEIEDEEKGYRTFFRVAGYEDEL